MSETLGISRRGLVGLGLSAAALAEPWRDAAHEAETQAAGAVTQDLRIA